MLTQAALAQVNTLSECERQQGFRLLFDGTRASFEENFGNWVSGTEHPDTLASSWEVSANDSAVVTPNGNSRDIRSKWMVEDFDLRLDYRNSGENEIFYKMLVRGDFPWSTATEFSIQNNPNTSGIFQAGGLFSLMPPTIPPNQSYHTYATGNWNSVRIVAKGDSVEHWLNGIKVLAFRYWNAAFREAYQNSKWSGDGEKMQNTRGCQCPIRRGYIGFQGDHDGRWHLRNLRFNADSARIAFGQVGCPLPVRSDSSVFDRGYSLHRRPRDILLTFNPVRATEIEALGLDGRPRALAAISADGTSATLRGWNGPGLCILRVRDSDRKIHWSRIYLH